MLAIVRTRMPHGHALRIGRFSERNRIYVVTSVTFEREPIFAELELGRILVNAFRYQQSRCNAATLAFVVMPDHFHWLLRLLEDTPLSTVVQAVKSYSATRINRVLRKRGRRRVWQAGFHDHAVRREEDLAAIARYIVANPVRAGLVRNVREYSLWDAAWLPS